MMFQIVQFKNVMRRNVYFIYFLETRMLDYADNYVLFQIIAHADNTCVFR